MGVSHTLKDIRPRAEEKARKKADELQERQSGDTVRPPGTGFETERARAKQALRDEVNAQNGQSVRKIAATSGPAVSDLVDALAGIGADLRPQGFLRPRALCHETISRLPLGGFSLRLPCFLPGPFLGHRTYVFQGFHHIHPCGFHLSLPAVHDI